MLHALISSMDDFSSFLGDFPASSSALCPSFSLYTVGLFLNPSNKVHLTKLLHSTHAPGVPTVHNRKLSFFSAQTLHFDLTWCPLSSHLSFSLCLPALPPPASGPEPAGLSACVFQLQQCTSFSLECPFLSFLLSNSPTHPLAQLSWIL